ncbi:MAG: hypothetical protein V7K64_28535 [Nostoc sp.]
MPSLRDACLRHATRTRSLLLQRSTAGVAIAKSQFVMLQWHILS